MEKVKAQNIRPIPIPQPCLNEGEEMVAYTPYVYKGSAPDPLPSSEEVEVEKQTYYENKKIELEEKKKEAESSGSFFSKFSVKLASAYNHVSQDLSKASDKVKNETKKLAKKKFESDFRKHFGLPGSERMLHSFTCSCINGKNTSSGDIYVSQNYLSFYGKVQYKKFLAFIIPLQNIVSIQKATCIDVENSNVPVMHITDNPQIQTGIQIYTIDGTLHSFYAFWSHRYKSAFLSIETSWRNSFNETNILQTPVQESYGSNLPEAPEHDVKTQPKPSFFFGGFSSASDGNSEGSK